jgi:hypothetical protein
MRRIEGRDRRPREAYLGRRRLETDKRCDAGEVQEGKVEQRKAEDPATGERDTGI